MKTYTIPKMTSEQFASNEYISACWQVACKVGDGDYGPYGYWENWRHWDGRQPYGNNCHDHTDSSDQGELRGGYTDYIDRNNNNTIDAGDTIFWYTVSSNGDRRWNHYGTVESSTNRS